VIAVTRIALALEAALAHGAAAAPGG